MSAPDLDAGLSRKRLVLAVLFVSAMAAGASALSGGLPFVGGSAVAVGPVGGIGLAGDATAVRVVAADPVDVVNDSGEAGVVNGRLAGSLVVADDADRVDFLVRSRLPDGTWVDVERATRRDVAAGEVDLGAVFGETVYLDGDQSDGFDVAERGSAAVREGAVSVTATLYLPDGTAETVTGVDTYRFTVDRPASAVVSVGVSEEVDLQSEKSPGESGSSSEQSEPSGGPAASNAVGAGTVGGGGGSFGGGGQGGPAGEPTAPGEESTVGDGSTPTRATALFGVGTALPGDGGESAVVLQNPDPDFGNLMVSVGAVVDEENGLTEPESEVDNTADVGELSEHLDVRVFVLRDSGERRYVVGGPNDFVALAAASGEEDTFAVAADESVSLVVQWRIDGDVGNEIQSDGTTLSIHALFTS